ncbi:MAG: tetratricopeptide repeat protein [Acidobacteriota bacterium]
MLTTRKKIIFSAATVGFAFILVACLELMLRVLSPAAEDRIVSTVTYDNIEWQKLNRSYLKRYFSSSDVLIPELKDELLRVKRTDRSIRIVCLGESSMFGVPYQINANIPAIIRRELRALYPDREIEVINAAASAINSPVIADMARAVSELEPDLVLIYLGHNEFYGPDGVGVSKLEKLMPFMTDVKHWMKRTAIARMIDSLGGVPAQQPGETRTLMQQVSQNTGVELYSPDAERIFSNYEKNLRAMIAHLRAKKIRIMFSDAASNLSFAPFLYASPGESFERDVVGAFTQARYAELERRLAERLPNDSTNAFVLYWLGRTEERLGRYDEARALLIRAKDHDLLKFRAPERTNAVLHRVCAELGVPCIASDSLLRAACAHGISDTTLFWEHVHPNARGYYLIASHVVRSMASYGLLPESERIASQALLPWQADSLGICELDLAYGERSMTNLTSHWPFRNFQMRTPVLDRSDNELKSIVEGMFRRAYVWDEACYRSAQVFAQKGRMREAQTTYEAVTDVYPYNFYAHYMLGNLLNRMNRPADALKHFDIAVASNPGYAHARVERALTNVNFGRVDAALADFAAARQIVSPGDASLSATIAYGTAVAWANKRDFGKALQFVDEALRIAPAYGSALQLKAGILAAMKH